MSGPNLYAILGVSRGADAAAIKQAYRRRAFESHPDTGLAPDSEQFRLVREAYAVLADPARRCRYDRETGSINVTVEPVAPEGRGPIAVPDDLETIVPPISEMLDPGTHISPGFHRKSGGPPRRLGLEIALEPREARFGTSVSIQVPVHRTCVRCGGSGARWGVCPGCHGGGIAEEPARVLLHVAPGMRGGEQFEISLGSAGIRKLVLHVRIALL